MKGVAPYVLLYGAYVAALHLFPGPWHSWKHGYEGRAVDPWTLQHVLWGVLAQRMNVSAGQFMVLGLLNEAAELWIHRCRPQWLWGSPETPANVVADLATNMVGWYGARWIGGRS